MFSLVTLMKTLIETEATTHPLKTIKGSTPAAKPVVDAIVTQTIGPGRKGQVKFQGSWWTARCSQDITLSPGKLVCVIDRQLITLYVEPVLSNAQGH